MNNAAAVVLPILTLLVHTTVGMYCISSNLRWAPMIGSYDALVCKRSGQLKMIDESSKSKAKWEVNIRGLAETIYILIAKFLIIDYC